MVGENVVRRVNHNRGVVGSDGSETYYGALYPRLAWALQQVGPPKASHVLGLVMLPEDEAQKASASHISAMERRLNHFALLRSEVCRKIREINLRNPCLHGAQYQAAIANRCPTFFSGLPQRGSTAGSTFSRTCTPDDESADDSTSRLDARATFVSNT
ncbi:hypothetical protein N658DRAFT_86180 [Parathielavia hyrcaniae]|uniref:Uncharacterized protein n=1 Tax=Parathielavia hyrcaniae TaxID=113614 RepID=A0AAN6PZL6_9PEZI|nr:hypothetical protein N658DRAFT_86180 [Parathielavia hyrcaniae]